MLHISGGVYLNPILVKQVGILNMKIYNRRKMIILQEISSMYGISGFQIFRMNGDPLQDNSMNLV